MEPNSLITIPRNQIHPYYLLFKHQLNFVLDGAPCHGVDGGFQILHSMFGENIIHLKGDLPHPGHSPDFSACDGAIWPIVRIVIFRIYPKYESAIFLLKWQIEAQKSKMKNSWNSPYYWCLEKITKRKYIHPTPDVLPLDEVISRFNAFYDPANPDGISAQWSKIQNWILGFRSKTE